MFRLLQLVFLTASFLCGSSEIQAEVELAARARIVVSVFNDARVDGGMLLRAQERATNVLRRAGVDVAWLECDSHHGNASKACLLFSDQHFALRIIPRSLNLKSEVFGVAFLGQNGRGTQADVFFEEVAKLSTDDRVSISDLLGHVMAHELGHLMLGTHSHSVAGIMRPRWQAAELQSMLRGALSFGPEQAELMRTRLRLPDEQATESKLVH